MLEKLGFWGAVIVTSKLNWCSNGVVGNFTKPKSPYFRAFSGFLTDIAQAHEHDFRHGLYKPPSAACVISKSYHNPLSFSISI